MMKIFLDSSVIIAFLKEDDSHYADIHSLMNFVHEKYFSNKIFVTNEIVILESISKLALSGLRIKNSIEKIEKFIKKYKIYIISRDTNEFIESIFEYYKEFSRKKFKKLQSNDFLIISDAIKNKALLITCDIDFFKYKARNFKDVYFISSRSKKQKDQYLKLLSKFFKNNN